MVVSIYKKPAYIDSTGPHDPRRTYHYGVTGTISESMARALTSTALGPVITTPSGTLYRGDITCSQTAWDKWDCDVEYIRRPKDIGTYTWTLDGTGASEHITHSLETIAAYPNGIKPGETGALAPNFKGAIGFNNGEIEGADVIVPAGKLTVTFSHPAGVITGSYAKFVSDLAGYVNSSVFLWWAPGEVRFLGPIMSDGTEVDTQATYNFDLSRNKTGLTVGGVTGIAKAGWHLIWNRLKDTTDVVSASGTTYPARHAEFVYIERVSNTIDFRTALGFG